MVNKITLTKFVENCEQLKGTAPGFYDFDLLIESDVDAYDPQGRLLFKFRKTIVPAEVNNEYHRLSDICVRTASLRSDAAGLQTYEESRVIGYDLNLRSYGCVAETKFTRSEHAKYKKMTRIIEMIDSIYKREFAAIYYFQEKLDIDPHFLVGRTVFSQCILNKSFRTCLHRDRSNAEGTYSNMICLGDNSFSGGYLVLPEYRVAINMRPRDYFGFNGREIWHGNTQINGDGTRLTIVCYVKKEIIGKSYEEELRKMANKINLGL
ncbi:MAG: hypothetical protein SGJ18_15250 [Pseudomonadota bacterium]|nr:hypothetical protein [Pseudomonadota bacterium]